MRGGDERSGSLFSYVDLEDRVGKNHPLRAIREIANAALADLSLGDFSALYSGMGRPSIAPEMLLRAMLLQAFYSVRSERQLMERLEFDLLFRGSSASGPTSRHGTIRYSRRTATGSWMARSRRSSWLLCCRSRPAEEASVDRAFFRGRDADRGLGFDEELQAESLPLDLIRADPGDGDSPEGGGECNAPIDFKGEKRSNETHPEHDRSGRHALSQGAGHGGEAVLHRPWADGEPLGTACRCQADPRRARRGTVGRAPYHPTLRRSAGCDHARRRQELYDAVDFIEELRTLNVPPARGAEHEWPALARDRQADNLHPGYAPASASASGFRRRSVGPR